MSYRLGYVLPCLKKYIIAREVNSLNVLGNVSELVRSCSSIRTDNEAEISKYSMKTLGLIRPPKNDLAGYSA